MRKKSTNKNLTNSPMIKREISIYKIVIIDFEIRICNKSIKKEEINWIENRKTIEQNKDISFKVSTKLKAFRTSLLTQWIRICLPTQGTWVRSLVWEDSTCRRATKPLCHNYWAYPLEPTSHSYWALVLQLLKPGCLEPVLSNKRSTEMPWKAHTLQRRVAPACHN